MIDPAATGPDAIDGDLDGDLRGRVKSELEPGERLLWCGQPTRESPRSNTWFLVWGVIAALSLLAAVASFAAYSRDTRPDPAPRGDIPPLVGGGLAAFVFSGVITLLLAVAVGHRKSERVKKSGTLYALTDRRAIIWVPETSRGAVAVYTLVRGSVANVHRVEYPDGSGDVLLRVRGPQPFDSEPWGPAGFEGVAEVRRVEEQVRRTLVESLKPPDGA